MLMEKLARKIAKFHENYKSKILKDRLRMKEVYLEDPKEALFFIFSFSFYQGRRDELSKRFEEKAKEILNEFLNGNNIFGISKRRITDKNELQREYKELDMKLKKGGLNKKGDRLMVISLINLIQSNEEKNIVKFLREKIKNQSISEAYRTLDSIYSIGPKISSLILRDTVYIYKLEDYLRKPDDYYFLQPIDTWVHEVSKRIGLIKKDKIYKDEAKDITKKCFELGINPIHYNQGAWYIGKNSLQILLEKLSSS